MSGHGVVVSLELQGGTYNLSVVLHVYRKNKQGKQEGDIKWY